MQRSAATPPSRLRLGGNRDLLGKFRPSPFLANCGWWPRSSENRSSVGLNSRTVPGMKRAESTVTPPKLTSFIPTACFTAGVSVSDLEVINNGLYAKETGIEARWGGLLPVFVQNSQNQRCCAGFSNFRSLASNRIKEEQEIVLSAGKLCARSQCILKSRNSRQVTF